MLPSSTPMTTSLSRFSSFLLFFFQSSFFTAIKSTWSMASRSAGFSFSALSGSLSTVQLAKLLLQFLGPLGALAVAAEVWNDDREAERGLQVLGEPAWLRNRGGCTSGPARE